MSTDGIVQKIEAIISPQTPEAITLRWSLFYKPEQGVADPLPLMNRIFPHFCTRLSVHPAVEQPD